MPQRRLLRYLLLAALGLIAGVAALAFAIAIEPEVSAVLIALFSPGLKLAELMAPETHKSIAWTFSWFLRIAIAANAAVLLCAICSSRLPRGSAPFKLDRRGEH